jgi:hypothetical protein
VPLFRATNQQVGMLELEHTVGTGESLEFSLGSQRDSTVRKDKGQERLSSEAHLIPGSMQHAKGRT